MRLLLILPWGERLGGAEAMIQTVLDGVRQVPREIELDGVGEAPHQIDLVFCQDGTWPAELRAAGFHVEVVPADRLRHAHRWPGTVARLARIMRARQPDLILNWSAKTQLFGAPAAALAGMSDRVLWWQHNIPERHWLDRCATALPAIAVGCSSQACARGQARLSPRRRTFVVTPGSRTAADRTGEPPASDVPVVGLVGRLEPWKGHDRLLRAQALLRERGQRLHLLLVGGDAYDISPDYARSLPALIEELGLGDAVTLTGQVPDAAPYIERMDVLVNASEGEPFGIVMLEGMARGVPVVAVAQGGPAEVIEHGRTGLLARSGESAALADALEPLLRSPELRQAIGLAGRRRFERDFTEDAMRARFFAELRALRPERRATARGSDPGAITIVAHDIGPVGGMERQLSELIVGLRRHGHHVSVIARTCELPSDTEVAFHRVPGPARPFLLAYPWFMLAGSLAVRRHRRGAVQATGAIVLNRVDGIAVHCFHQVHRAAPPRPRRLHRWHARLVALVARVAERLCFRANRSARFVCVSDGLAEELRTHLPELAGRVVTIHNGVDTDAFAPGTRAEDARALRERLGLAPGRLVLAFVGGDWGHKGLAHAIGALAQAPDWDLVVAGRGHAADYQQLADSLRVGHRVHWLGVVRDIPVVYELADAFVLPSGYETFSLVTFEAAASGLPILATPVNGVRELIEDGRNGYLIAARSDDIARRLRQLGAEPELRERLGEAARRSVKRFRWEEMVAAHRELYALDA